MKMLTAASDTNMITRNKVSGRNEFTKGEEFEYLSKAIAYEIVS